MNFNTLVLSGGGIKGLAHLGALRYLQDSGGAFCLNSIKIYSGTSIGSVVCLMLICGYEPDTLLFELRGLNSFVNLNNMNILSFFTKYGLFSIDELSNIVKEKILKKLGYIPTLKQLYDLTHKDLYACVVDSTTSDVVYLNYRTHPDMNCVEAVENSCRIPLIFEKGKYLDGGLIDNMPIHALVKNYDLRDLNILGILLIGKEAGYLSIASNTGFLNYIYNLLNISINANTYLRIEHIQEHYKSIRKGIDIVIIPFEKRSLIPVYISESEKLEIFGHGYNVMKKYWENKNRDIIMEVDQTSKIHIDDGNFYDDWH